MRKIIPSIILLLVCSSLSLYAQRPRIGLALGGGGAKGAAEVGVLKVLEEEGIRPDFIAGTSIGSIVGGLYAIGYSADSLRSLFHDADWAELLSDGWFHSEDGYDWLTASGSIPMATEKFGQALQRDGELATRPFWQRGFVRGTMIHDFFSRLTHKYRKKKDFDKLPTPFRAVAADMKSGREVIISRGTLADAMRASMSIPALFEPVAWGEYILVDGGARNNFPVDVCRDMGADIVIGIDLSQVDLRREDAADEPSLGLFDVLWNAVTGLLGGDKYNTNKNAADVYINPSLGNYGPFDFTQQATDEMYQMGYDAADKIRPLLRELKQNLAQ